ncbi:MAG: serine/threonine-protein kinase [Acidobacteriota bacterium]
MANEPPRDRTLTHTAAGDAASGVEPAFALPDRWRLARLLGHGGQAEVWLAHDGELDEWVAVKVFRPDLGEPARERLRREVRLGRSLRHPNLVRMFELIEAGDRLAVVMEHVPGGSLAQRASGGQVPVAEVVRFAGEVLAALEFLHGQGVVHRDVKPSNLLLDAEGRVRLADFGLVRRLEGDADLTRTSMAVGTPFYMSPEQIRGARAGFPADLYGLGVTVYELLAGQAPFTGGSQLEVASQHLQVEPPDVRRLRPECPRWLARFVRRLLEKRPEDRWPDAGSARRAFTRRRVFASPRTWRRAIAGAAAAIALIAAAAGLLRHNSAGPASVAVSGDGVAALDARGREMWRRQVPAPRAAVVGELLVEGTRGVAVVTSPEPGGTPPDAGDVVVFDESGTERARFPSVPAVLANFYPEFIARMETGKLLTTDLDRNGRQELVWLANHVMWYPSVLGMWSPGTPVDRLPVLFNSGTLLLCSSGDVDGDGDGELVVAGLNNPIGYQAVVAILEAPSPGAYGPATVVSPDLVHQWVERAVSGDRLVRAYVPFHRVALNTGTLRVGRRRIEVGREGASVAFDLDGNPEGSPLFGRGPAARNAFWDALTTLLRSIETGTADGPAEIDALFARHAEVLQEAPMRLAAELLAARALAFAGLHEQAIGRLRAAARAMPGERDLQLRLAEQLVAVGRTGEASAILSAELRPRLPGRGPLDPVIALALVGALENDRAVLATAGRAWREFSPGAGAQSFESDLQAYFAFCRGDFPAATLAPAAATSGFVRGVGVLRAWAQLERGSDTGDVVRRAQSLVEDPETRWPARTLEAHALTRAGDPRRAADLAAVAVANLEKPARVGVEARLWLALASRVAADALEACGDRASASGHAARARRLAPRCWFGSEK